MNKLVSLLKVSYGVVEVEKFNKIIDILEIKDNCDVEFLMSILYITQCYDSTLELNSKLMKNHFSLLYENTDGFFSTLKMEKIYGTLAVGLFNYNFTVLKIKFIFK